jgi:hypothetical protein
MQDGIHPPKGRVDLYEKRCPSVDLPAHEQDSNTWCTSYGQVDVSRVVHRLNKLGTPIWEDEYNKNENVLIQRPFHDNIGVGKIVCLFCDNSMDATYQLPAWHTWKDLLVPIFESIGLRTEHVVRCLFARMPPGAVIPRHHDNGKWVGWTHRVHIPLITNAHVVFESGPTEERMQRIAFDAGSAIELNNAAKHYVANESDQFRVHLILDWLEPDRGDRLPRPVQLKPGQRVSQLRGRIMLLSEEPTEDESVQDAASAEAAEALARHAVRRFGAGADTELKQLLRKVG